MLLLLIGLVGAALLIVNIVSVVAQDGSFPAVIGVAAKTGVPTLDPVAVASASRQALCEKHPVHNSQLVIRDDVGKIVATGTLLRTTVTGWECYFEFKADVADGSDHYEVSIIGKSTLLSRAELAQGAKILV